MTMMMMTDLEPNQRLLYCWREELVLGRWYSQHILSLDDGADRVVRARKNEYRILTAYKTHGCIKPAPISARKIKKKKQSTNIKRDEINIMNKINDNTFNLHKRLLNNPNWYMKIILKWRLIVYRCRVFASGSGDRGSLSGQVIPKTQKVVLDTSLLNTQHSRV